MRNLILLTIIGVCCVFIGSPFAKGEEMELNLKDSIEESNVVVNRMFLPVMFMKEKSILQDFHCESFPYSCKTFYNPLQITLPMDNPTLGNFIIRNKIARSAINYVIAKHPECVAYTYDMLPKVERNSLIPPNNLKMLSTNLYNQTYPTIQVSGRKHKLKKWIFKSNHVIQGIQNYNTKNWKETNQEVKSFSVLSVQSVSLNYNSYDKLLWENSLSWRLDFASTNGDSIHKTQINDDQIRFDTKLLYRAVSNLAYALTGTFTTPIFNQYKKNSNQLKQAFFSPAEVSGGLGISWRLGNEEKNLCLTTIFSPVSLYWKYVKNETMDSPNTDNPTKRSFFDFGNTLNIYLIWKIAYNIKWDSRFYFFTNYSRVLIEFENTLRFTINRFLSVILYVYPRFSDNDPSQKSFNNSYMQFKEGISLGFDISF
ncbi:MAG TPA: hypothetical protein DDY68_02055 [Porphyromonadaceae bacterium]|nr:hypothetical protein [Porphyromonadaceae bacterium]